MNGQEIFLGLSYISRKYIEEAAIQRYTFFILPYSGLGTWYL